MVMLKLIYIFVVLITNIMLSKESINVPEVSESPIPGVGYKPFTGGTPYFSTMKMIQNLGRIYATSKSKQRTLFAIYECPYCKEPFKAMTSHIKDWHTQSCGCKSHELTASKKTTHGISSHPIYGAWRNMIRRCKDPKEKEYKNYGARGISVCVEWEDNVTTFYNWAMQNGYKEGLVLDREDNEGNYEPNNCRWINTNVSAENKRLLRYDNKTGYRGIMFRKKKNLKRPWRAMINWNNIAYKLGYYSTPRQAAQAYNNFVIIHKTNHPLNKL